MAGKKLRDPEGVSATVDTEHDAVAYASEARSRRNAFRRAPAVLFDAVQVVWRAHRGLAATVAAVSILSALMGVGQVLLTRAALQSLGDVDDGAYLGSPAVPVMLLALVTIAMMLMDDVNALTGRLLGARVTRDMTRRVFDVTTIVPLDAYETSDFYNQLQRVRTAAAVRPLQVVSYLVAAVTGLLGSLGVLAVIAGSAPLLIPGLLLAGLPLALAGKLTGRREFALTVAQAQPSRERGYLEQVLTQRDGAKELRSCDTGAALRRSWETSYVGYLRDLGGAVRYRLTLSAVSLGLAGVLGLATVGLLLVLLERGDVELAEAGALAVALRLLSIRGRQVTMGIGGLLESHLFLEDLDQFVQLGRRHRQRSDGLMPASPPEKIVLRGVTYTYPGAESPSLRDIDLTLRRGETIALVGENGSGKTTLAKLLAALHAPTDGTLEWDDVDVQTLDPASMRRHIGVVFQDFMRYQLSARDNIALGKPELEPDVAEVEQAARLAGVDTLLRGLPRGLDTVLSKAFQGGRELSLGQWQRVALARVYYRDAEVIILDEPTAALDPRAEHDLYLHIRDLLVDRTVVLISHRFSSVRMADKIYVLDAGAIVESGSHEELLRQVGQYAELFTLQAQAYLADGSGRPAR